MRSSRYWFFFSIALVFICPLLTHAHVISKKSVGVNLLSKWTQTPLHLEAGEFFAEESKSHFVKYLQCVRQHPSPQDPKQQYELINDCVDELLVASSRPLLRFSLSLRSYSPKIAMFEQITTQAIGEHKRCDQFVQLSGEKEPQILCSLEELEQAINAHTNIKKQLVHPNLYEQVDHLIQGEINLPLVAVLHGDYSNTEFHKLMDKLQAYPNLICLYVRPFGPVSELEKVSLSGYGVELQIKSTEYKAQDDTRVKGEESTFTAKLSEREKSDASTNGEFEGINFTILKNRFPEHDEKLEKMFEALIEASKEIATLKIWELQELSLQTAKKVLSAPISEQLRLLRDIVQNFPVYAKSLVKLHADDQMRREVEKNQGIFLQTLNIGTGDSALFINGMFFDMDSVDVFTLVHFLRQESRLLVGLAKILGNGTNAQERISSLVRLDVNDEKSGDYQIDIRDSAIVYINDIENDKIYRNWPASIQDLLRPTYPGMLRNVRKNLYHLVLVVDPSKKESFDIIKLAESFYVHKAPLRIGFVFAVNEDRSINGYQDAGIACLNAFNYISSASSAYEALSFFTDLIATAENGGAHDLKTQHVINIFKSKYPKANLDFVFGEDSEYDSGRMLAWDFLNRTAIGKPIQVLLNGVLIKESQLNGDMFEEAVLSEIMKQTPTLQKAVYKGEITDSMNVLDYLMSQKHVIPRLNKKILHADSSTKIVDLSELVNVDESFASANWQFDKEETYSSATKLAFLHYNLHYLYVTEPRADEGCSITLWLVADYSEFRARSQLITALSYLKESAKHLRLALLYRVANEEARILYALQRVSLKPSRMINILIKWASKQLTFKETEQLLPDEKTRAAFKSEFESIHTEETIRLHEAVISSELLPTETNEIALVVNGRIISSSELFVENDFSLIEKHTMSIYGDKIALQLRRMRLCQNNDQCSTLKMSISSVLCANPSRKMRHQISYYSDKHSVLHIPAQLSEEPAIDLVAIIEPLSRGAQKLTSILLALQGVVNANIKIFLNCIEKHSDMPLKNFFRFVINEEPHFETDGSSSGWPQNHALFEEMPSSPLLTLGMVTPENWMVESVNTKYDLDNIHLEQVEDGFGIFADFELEHLLLEGHCFDQSSGKPPRGLQFILTANSTSVPTQDTIVMDNLGYFQLKANPGAWNLRLRPGRSEDIYAISSHESNSEREIVHNEQVIVLIQSFRSNVHKVRVSKKFNKQNEELLYDTNEQNENSLWDSLSSWTSSGTEKQTSLEAKKDSERLNIFSLASGHLYERLLRIMMLSVLKNTKTPVKFWFLKNYLSPTFKNILPVMAEKYGFEFELVQYKWPRWLHQQTEKQRIIWGYKILFLDVLFPLDVKKIIFVDADQVVRTDLTELRDFDLEGAPYGYTPFCDSREDMDGFRFWKHGYWASHLQGRKYHISALYVVDLVKFRLIGAGDRLRGQYQGLSQDPNSLSNLDQDLPNNMIDQVAIKSLPQEWLWCETWCDSKSKKKAKTIDLCNNPKTKEPKLTAAKRILPEWVGYDEEIKQLIDQYTGQKNMSESMKSKSDSPTQDSSSSQTVHTEL